MSAAAFLVHAVFKAQSYSYSVLLFLHYLSSCPLLLPRVVNVSSISEQLGLFALYTPTIPYDDIPGYNLGTDSGEKPYVMAKTHILMATTRELAKRLEGSGVDVIAGRVQSRSTSDEHSSVLCIAQCITAIDKDHDFAMCGI